MEIRQFRPDESDHVIRLWQDCGLVRPWNDPRRDIERKLTEQPELFLVGVVDATIVATAHAGLGALSRGDAVHAWAIARSTDHGRG